jgi:protein tyrosine phosphatase type 4A
MSYTLLTDENRRFLILGAPESPKNLKSYVQRLKENNVVALVRACESNYSTDLFEAEGIKVYDLSFEDGGVPSRELIVKWLDLVAATFPKQRAQMENEKLTVPPALAVHCQAGLGRAPVLVAVALIENGMDNLSAINYVRERRRDAFNQRQLSFLIRYKPLQTDCRCSVR